MSRECGGLQGSRGYGSLVEQLLDLVVPFDRLVAKNFAALLNEYNRQESIPVGCILNVCVDYTCFNGHQMSALWGAPKVNKFEKVSSDGHQMSLAGGPCPVKSPV